MPKSSSSAYHIQTLQTLSLLACKRVEQRNRQKPVYPADFVGIADKTFHHILNVIESNFPISCPRRFFRYTFSLRYHASLSAENINHKVFYFFCHLSNRTVGVRDETVIIDLFLNFFLNCTSVYSTNQSVIFNSSGRKILKVSP